MMQIVRFLSLVVLAVVGLAAVGCGQAPSTSGTYVEPGKTAVGSNFDDISKGTNMKITIGSKVFQATLYDNPTATAFKAMLPLTIEMGEFNGNEKDHKFASSFPTEASNPGTIKAGDLMIWGDNTLVLFYKSLRTSYSYTKLGRIEDAAGLEVAVGKGNVSVTFELDR